MSALRIFRRRPSDIAELAYYREQARKDAITIEAQGRAIRDLKRDVAELRAQLAATVEVQR